MSIKTINNFAKITFMILVVFLVCVKSAKASLEITEIMYDPVGSNTGHQWVEIYNNSADSFEVDAIKWRFNDGSSHYLNDKANFIVEGHSYFIITGDKDTFLSDHSGYSGQVIDTVLSLDKDGDTVSIINDGTTVNSTTYTSSMGASEDSNSLQKIGSSWKGGLPTPGAQNEESAPVIIDPNTNTNTPSTTSPPPAPSSSSSGSGSSGVKTVNAKVANAKIATNIISKKIVVSGVAFDIKSETIGQSKEILTNGRLVWNFGDGEIKNETIPTKFTHTYFYPGEYVVTLEYYDTIFDTEPKAVDRLVIKVLDVAVIVSAVGDSKDPYIELKNESNNEIDISGWNINGTNHVFKIPRGTSLLGNHSLKISSRITAFDYNDVTSIRLTNPTGDLISTYPDSSLKKLENNLKDTSEKYTKASEISSDTEAQFEVIPQIKKDTKVVDLNNLSASAVESVTKEKSNTVTNKDIAYAGLGVLLITALATVLINKNKIKTTSDKNNEDFKILE